MQDASIWSFITHAGPIVKLVMSLLFFASLASWTMIFERFFYFRELNWQVRHFERQFNRVVIPSELYQQLAERKKRTGIEDLVCGGIQEFLTLKNEQQMGVTYALQSAERKMQLTLDRETAFFERHLAVLATIGSVSPYVGLFGTVWGIMTSFRALSAMQQATLAMVAPGISEALIATAIGLFTAIPAVIAYNRYTQRAEQLLTRYELIKDELMVRLRH